MARPNDTSSSRLSFRCGVRPEQDRAASDGISGWPETTRTSAKRSVRWYRSNRLGIAMAARISGAVAVTLAVIGIIFSLVGIGLVWWGRSTADQAVDTVAA